jgi:flagellar hook-length control protein FliK
MLGGISGSGKAKESKAKNKPGSFANLVKTLLENVRPGAPELAVGQLKAEKPQEGQISGKTQSRKSLFPLFSSPNTDSWSLQAAENAGTEEVPGETTDERVIPFVENQTNSQESPAVASLQAEPERKNPPLPVEEPDFSRQEAVQSLADLMRKPARTENREQAQADDPAQNRVEQLAGQASVGLVDLERTARNRGGEQEDAGDRRRQKSLRTAEGRFEVRDLRGSEEPGTARFRPADTQGPAGSAGSAGLAGGREDAGVELTVRLDGPRNGDGQVQEGRAQTSFRDALAQELRGALGQDIVRHASIILKDGGEGLIRLSLKPESLGNVKIRLELSENKIAGRIIVENSDALRAFERELPVLEAAFKDSGFEGASLELTRDGGDRGRWNGEEARPFYSERLVSSSYEALTDYSRGNVLIYGDTQVNMLA